MYKRQDVHGACVGPSGGVFMSIQQWLNDTAPSCVSKDYDGIALAADHTTTVGSLEHKDLTWRDAASSEDTPPPWLADERS